MITLIERAAQSDPRLDRNQHTTPWDFLSYIALPASQAADLSNLDTAFVLIDLTRNPDYVKEPYALMSARTDLCGGYQATYADLVKERGALLLHTRGSV